MGTLGFQRPHRSEKTGGGGGFRTPGPRLMSPLLYHLSYTANSIQLTAPRGSLLVMRRRFYHDSILDESGYGGLSRVRLRCSTYLLNGHQREGVLPLERNIIRKIRGRQKRGEFLSYSQHTRTLPQYLMIQ